MKIVFVTEYLGDGGAEREITAFASAFAKMGQEVHIVRSKGLEKDYELDPRVCLHYIPLVPRVKNTRFRVLSKWRNVVPKLRRLRADILLPVNLSPPYYPCLRLAAMFSGTKLLYAVRNNLEKKYVDEKNRKRWRNAARAADGIWIQTEAQRMFFPKRMQKKIFVVSNILDGHFLSIPSRERKTICRFISVGRLHPQKNQKMLIEAFAEMVSRTGNSQATLAIYGRVNPADPSIKEELETLIHCNHLEERIFLPGRIQEIEKKYEEADVFVFSSDYEGMPNALMEAMAAGLPCISTDCPTGPSALIENGENGLLVPVGDVEAMAFAMQYVVEHPQEADRLGRAAKQRMQEWGTAQEHAEQLLENLYRIRGRGKHRG